jgi:hypothetical protein
MPLALSGSLTAVQICYPADLSLILTKNPIFRSGTDMVDLTSWQAVFSMHFVINFNFSEIEASINLILNLTSHQ